MQTRFHTRCHGVVCLNLSARSTHGPHLPELSPSQSLGTEMASHLRSGEVGHMWYPDSALKKCVISLKVVILSVMKPRNIRLKQKLSFH